MTHLFSRYPSAVPAPTKPPDWKVGDAVYSLLIDQETFLYRVHGVGRIVRIEGATLHLATKRGPRTWGATDWPAFRSREDAEAYIRDKPGPQWSQHGRGDAGVG